MAILSDLEIESFIDSGFLRVDASFPGETPHDDMAWRINVR